jgi:hypothetical protein
MGGKPHCFYKNEIQWGASPIAFIRTKYNGGLAPLLL